MKNIMKKKLNYCSRKKVITFSDKLYMRSSTQLLLGVKSMVYSLKRRKTITDRVSETQRFKKDGKYGEI